MKHICTIIQDASLKKVEPLKSGFGFIDDELGGYHPGEMMTICGVENSGKTAFILSQIDRLAVEQGIPTLVGFGTMDISMVVASMMSYHYDIETNNLWKLLDDPQYKTQITEYESLLKEAPLYVLDNDIRDENWEKTISEWITNKGIRIILLDEWETITEKESSIGLKQLAISTGVSVVMTNVIWNDRPIDGFGVRLSDLNSRKCSSVSALPDTVIAFNDYEFMKIFADEHGVNLRGVLGIEILKHKGVIKKKEYRMIKKRLYYHNKYSDSCFDVPEPLPLAKHF